MDKRKLFLREIMKEDNITEKDILDSIRIPARICKMLKSTMHKEHYDNSYCFDFCPYASAKERDSCLYRYNGLSSDPRDEKKLYDYEENIENKLNQAMNPSFMDNVAIFFGLQINQKFKISGSDDVFMFGEKQFMNISENCVAPIDLMRLLNGEAHVTEILYSYDKEIIKKGGRKLFEY